MILMPRLPDPITYHVHWGCLPTPPEYYSYVLARQGVFKWAVRPQFELSFLISPVDKGIAGLSGWSRRSVLRAPKIPGQWLTTVLHHARRAGIDRRTAHPIEQMYHFHYFAKAGWQVSLPPQSAASGRVAYVGGADKTIVLDLHSHHNMPAYFSQTDDRDEQGCRFYAVIGNIFRDRPEIAVRAGIWGDFQRISPAILFEHTGPFVPTEVI